MKTVMLQLGIVAFLITGWVALGAIGKPVASAEQQGLKTAVFAVS